MKIKNLTFALAAIAMIACTACSSDDNNSSDTNTPTVKPSASITYTYLIDATVLTYFDASATYDDHAGKSQVEKFNTATNTRDTTILIYKAGSCQCKVWNKTISVTNFPQKIGYSISLALKSDVDTAGVKIKPCIVVPYFTYKTNNNSNISGLYISEGLWLKKMSIGEFIKYYEKYSSKSFTINGTLSYEDSKYYFSKE